MLRGWLGHALKRHNATRYRLFYGKHADHQIKPYAIRVSNDCQNWHAGVTGRPPSGIAQHFLGQRRPQRRWPRQGKACPV